MAPPRSPSAARPPAPRPSALPNRTTRPTGTVPWAPNSGWDVTDGNGRRIPVPQSPVELGRFLLDAFRRNLNGPR
jgi:hypothetical protein